MPGKTLRSAPVMLALNIVAFVMLFLASPASGGEGFGFPNAPEDPALRVSCDLSGSWECARFDDPNMDRDPLEPVRALPADFDGMTWAEIAVPGDAFAVRPEMDGCHRFFYRTRVRVPVAYAGRGAFLHFSGTNYIVSVFVNRTFIGSHRGVLVPWDMDISCALKAGRENELVIAVKSPWYAADPKPKDRDDPEGIHAKRNLKPTYQDSFYFVDTIFPSTKGEGDGLAVGLVNPVRLVSCGELYVSDVHIMTSVSEKTLTAVVTVHNPSERERTVELAAEAVHDASGAVEKRLAPISVRVPARGERSVRLEEKWEAPKLWWPSESVDDMPDCYQLRTIVREDGAALDRHETLFGFREVSIDGVDILLNGVPWHFYNWVDVDWSNPPVEERTPEEWLRRRFRQGDSYHRIAHDHDRLFGCREEALEWLDRHGIAGRLSTCIDGMFITHDLENPLVWENFRRHVRQVVTAYRNHPSVMHWSLENELIYIAARLGFTENYAEHEQRLADLFAEAAKLDPTRPSFGDGAGDLRGKGPINCQHYSWDIYRNAPFHFYGPIRNPRPKRGPASRWGGNTDLYVWTGKNPLIVGEEFYWGGGPEEVKGYGGPDVYDSAEALRRGAVRLIRMGIEGHRWSDVAGVNLWTHWQPGAEKAFAPRAVFTRDHNQCFLPGSDCVRRIAVFNDGRRDDPLTLKWSLVHRGEVLASGSRTYRIPPGRRQEDELKVAVPKTETRLDGELRLELYARGRRVFEDSKLICALPLAEVPEAFDPAVWRIYDPAGDTAGWLAARGVEIGRVSDIAALPGECRALIVGSNALADATRASAADALKDFVAGGGQAIVLDQVHPLEGDELAVEGIELAVNPAVRQDAAKLDEFLADGGGRFPIAHPTAPAHPVFRRLERDDFFTWQDSVFEPIFRSAYSADVPGATTLLVGGRDLQFAPLVEAVHGRGAYMLCQMDLRRYLDRGPVARNLLMNMIGWACERQSRPVLDVRLVPDGDREMADFLAGANLEVPPADGLGEAMGAGPAIVIAGASRENLAWLNAHRAAVEEFCDAGGWIMLHGLEDEDVELFDALTGRRHRIRPFRFEAVNLANRSDPLLLGISPADIAQFGDSKVTAFMPNNALQVSDAVFTQVVDAGEDIASFTVDGYGSVENTNTGKIDALVDNRTSFHHWVYTCYLPADRTSEVTFSLGRPEMLEGLTVWASDAYYMPRDVEVVLDGDQATARSLRLPPEVGPATVEFAPSKASRVAVRFLNHYPRQNVRTDIITIDEIALRRHVSAAERARCVPLTHPAGIVKYPIGVGGLLLNQLRLDEPDRSGAVFGTRTASRRTVESVAAENIAKKRKIMAALLRNMGAAF